MKKLYSILLSLFLSLLIVYMGVGIPFVQYSCATCSTTDGVSPLIVVTEFSGRSCDCGCSNRVASTNDHCAKKKGCCCCFTQDSVGAMACPRPTTKTPEPMSTDSEKGTSDNSCSKVRIEKINLPTLVPQLHLDTVMMPAMDFMFCNLCNLDINYYFERGRRYYEGAPPHNISPRAYINYICTLLI